MKNFSLNKVIVTALPCLLLAFTSLCQDTTAQFLGEVIITSQRSSQQSFSVPYSVASLSTAALEDYQPRTAPEALTGINGVFVQKTNHGGGSPFLRGVTGNQSLLLIDGIRMNNSTYRYGPNQYFNTIDVHTIDKIEVAKGTGSVQYGTDAIGGVIQVFTKEPFFSIDKPGWSGKMGGRFMTGNMEKSGRGEATYRSEKFAVQAGATYRNFGDLIGGDTTGKQAPSGYEEFSYEAKTKILLNHNLQLLLAHQFLKQEQVPVYHKIVLEDFAVNAFDPQQRMLTYAKLKQESNNKLISKIEWIASWHQTLEERISRKNRSSLLRRERDLVNTIGLTTDIFSRFSKRWTGNSGLEWYADKVRSSRTDRDQQSGEKKFMRGLYPDGSAYKNYSLYSLHHVEMNRWLMEAGLRLNAFNIHIKDTSLGNVIISPAALVYNASVMYKLSSEHHLYLSASSNFRAPNIDDMGSLGIVDFRYEVPATNLKPERSRNYEIGYKLKTRKWAAVISAYRMELKNLITRVKNEGEQINGYPVYRKENVDKAFIKGLETELAYQPLKSLLLQGSLAYTMGESITRKEPLRRIPPLNGRLISNYRNNHWMVSAEWLFASKQARLAQGDKEDNRIPTGGTPGWSIFNLYGGYTAKSFVLNLSLHNLFDQDYRTHGSGINGVGRSGRLSVMVRL